MTDAEKQQIKDTADQLEAGADRPVETQAANMLRKMGKRLAEAEYRFGHSLRVNADGDDYL